MMIARQNLSLDVVVRLRTSSVHHGGVRLLYVVVECRVEVLTALHYYLLLLKSIKWNSPTHPPTRRMVTGGWRGGRSVIKRGKGQALLICLLVWVWGGATVEAAGGHRSTLSTLLVYMEYGDGCSVEKIIGWSVFFSIRWCENYTAGAGWCSVRLCSSHRLFKFFLCVLTADDLEWTGFLVLRPAGMDVPVCDGS